MKKGVRIINCARGELIDDAALVEALKSGQVAGAALDVFAVEPLKDSPYAELENVILTPHIAGSTGEAQEAVGMQIARQVREYLKLGVVQNAVNLPSLSHEEYVVLAPYIDLAGRLGSFHGAGRQGRHRVDHSGLRRHAGRGQDGAGAQRGHRRAAGRLGEREPHQRGGAWPRSAAFASTRRSRRAIAAARPAC